MAGEQKILVVGSINMDLVVRTRHMPDPGETVRGDKFIISPGGKGANQAVAAARLGAECRMIGRVGADTFGEQLLAGLKAEGIDCTDVTATDEATTGVAMVIVDRMGENSIVVASGANATLRPDDLFARAELFADADAVLLQLELPLPTVRAAIQLAKAHQCRTVLDPAPAPKPMPADLCSVDILTPNVSEAQNITGKHAIEERIDKLVASELIGLGASAAVLKLGPRGSLVVMSDGHFYTVPAYKVEVVDTTAAGDAFTAALTLAVSRGQRLHEAARFANAAGALACTKFGAFESMPTGDEVRMLMEDQPN